MSMPMNLVLVRHGESVENVAVNALRKGDTSHFTEEFKRTHTSQFPLTAKGRGQAKRAGDWLRQEFPRGFYRYYTSPYKRARQTARYLDIPDARWYIDIDLHERSWGDIATLSPEERNKRFDHILKMRELAPLFSTVPSGETMAEMSLRPYRILGTLARECSGKDIICVCHGEIMWGFRIRIEHMTPERYDKLDRSKDPRDRIHNGQVLHYTRANPKTGEVRPHFGWLRSVCTSDTSLSQNHWEKIERPFFTNEELLASL